MPSRSKHHNGGRSRAGRRIPFGDGSAIPGSCRHPGRAISTASSASRCGRRRINTCNRSTAMRRWRIGCSFPIRSGSIGIPFLVTYRTYPRRQQVIHLFLPAARMRQIVESALRISTPTQSCPPGPASRFMEKEFPHMPTLAAIATSVHLSPFHFHRRFTELLGITPKQFLLECQIEGQRELARGRSPSPKSPRTPLRASEPFHEPIQTGDGPDPTRWRRLLTHREVSKIERELCSWFSFQ